MTNNCINRQNINKNVSYSGQCILNLRKPDKNDENHEIWWKMIKKNDEKWTKMLKNEWWKQVFG